MFRLNPEAVKRSELLKGWFVVQELVSPEVYRVIGDNAIMLFSEKVLLTLIAFKTDPYFKGAVININTWFFGGRFKARGYRELTEATGSKGSYHRSAEALDLDIVGFTAEEVRNRIKSKPKRYKYVRRLEADVNWVHFDVAETGTNEVVEFNLYGN